MALSTRFSSGIILFSDRNNKNLSFQNAGKWFFFVNREIVQPYRETFAASLPVIYGFNVLQPLAFLETPSKQGSGIRDQENGPKFVNYLLF